jgi:hypothetical protein
MAIIIGEGDYRYEVIESWVSLCRLKGSASISVQDIRSRADQASETVAQFDLQARLFWDRHGTAPRPRV